MPEGCSLPPTCPPGSTGAPTGPAPAPGEMPAGCTATPVTPQATTPVATTPAPTPTTTPTTSPAPDTQTAQGEEEDTPEQNEVQGENAEGESPGTEEDTAPSATAAPGPTQETGAGELPFTGVNAWWLGLLGLTVAGTGAVLRRRTSA
jgi:hypothetical protein